MNKNDLEIWNDFIGQNVVVDTNSSYVYLGKLVDATEHSITLSDVDIHDHQESSSTKEQYIINTKKSGIKKNRQHVVVRTSFIVSLSNLNDVIEY
ncbi:MAG: hypothetical protein KAI63_06475 [Planctomycetes bacterium]|nr:hypothetical protein [Planctomycetota bacterium]